MARYRTQESRHTFQFRLQFEYALENIEQSNNLAKSKLRLQEKKLQWHKENTELSEKSAAGIPVHSYQYERLTKELESINLTHNSIRLVEDRHNYTLQASVQKVLGYFNEIFEDHADQLTTVEAYEKYLQNYKTLLEKCNCLPASEANIIKKLQNEIKKHLTNKN